MQQLTLVNNVELDFCFDICGLSLRSVLGPLKLFLLHINDIKAVIQNSIYDLYAHDTILIQRASDPDSLIESLEGAVLNVDNCSLLLF